MNADRALPLDDRGAGETLLRDKSPAHTSPSDNLLSRLFSRRAAAMLGRNTVVSCLVFGLSFALLWLLVEYLHMNELIAACIGFVTANTVHYVLGRAWIFRGTDRTLASGYLLFLASGGLGLFVTMVLYWAFLNFTSVHYLVARILVSVFAGLAMFALNATVNFRRL